MRVIPGALLVIGQARVSFLDGLKLFCRVHVSVFVRMPLKGRFFVCLERGNVG